MESAFNLSGETNIKEKKILYDRRWQKQCVFAILKSEKRQTQKKRQEEILLKTGSDHRYTQKKCSQEKNGNIVLYCCSSSSQCE